jgi:hypothetical protein
MIMIGRAACGSPDDVWIGNEIMVPEGKRRQIVTMGLLRFSAGPSGQHLRWECRAAQHLRIISG